MKKVYFGDSTFKISDGYVFEILKVDTSTKTSTHTILNSNSSLNLNMRNATNSDASSTVPWDWCIW